MNEFDSLCSTCWCSVCGSDDVERVSMVLWECGGCGKSLNVREVGRSFEGECPGCGVGVLSVEWLDGGGVRVEHDVDGDDYCVVDSDGVVVDSGRAVGVAFDSGLIDGVVSGEKDVTFRYGFEKNVWVGRVFGVYDASKRYRVGDAVVRDVYELSIDEIVAREWEGHREYGSVGECVRVLGEYYPDVELDGNTVLTVLEYEYVRDVAACERS